MATIILGNKCDLCPDEEIDNILVTGYCHKYGSLIQNYLPEQEWIFKFRMKKGKTQYIIKLFSSPRKLW